METDTRVRLAVYRWLVERGRAPQPEQVAARSGVGVQEVLDAYRRLAARRLLVLEPDGATIRMAPPFSGIATRHRVEAGGRRYWANCAWDALGIPAALAAPATVRSHCARSGEELVLEVGSDGPAPSDWLFHSLVPAALWWDDIVFT